MINSRIGDLIGTGDAMMFDDNSNCDTFYITCRHDEPVPISRDSFCKDKTFEPPHIKQRRGKLKRSGR
jgi:hypothetical protein